MAVGYRLSGDAPADWAPRGVPLVPGRRRVLVRVHRRPFRSGGTTYTPWGYSQGTLFHEARKNPGLPTGAKDLLNCEGDDASTYFSVAMYFEGSFWKVGMQSLQQKPIVLPLYVVVTSGSILFSVSMAQYLLTIESDTLA